MAWRLPFQHCCCSLQCHSHTRKWQKKNPFLARVFLCCGAFFGKECRDTLPLQVEARESRLETPDYS
eukprot:2827698-Amphidinium_carterae.1